MQYTIERVAGNEYRITEGGLCTIAKTYTMDDAERIVKALQLLDSQPATVQEYVKASDDYTNALNEWLHNGKE